MSLAICYVKNDGDGNKVKAGGQTRFFFRGGVEMINTHDLSGRYKRGRSVKVVGDTDSLRDCRKQYAVSAQAPKWMTWITLKFFAENVFSFSVQTSVMVLLILLQGNPIYFWENIMEVCILNSVKMFVLIFYFVSLVMIKDPPLGYSSLQSLCKLKEKVFYK